MPKIKIKKDAKIIFVNTEKLKRLGKKFGFTFNKDKLLKKHKNGDVIFMRQKEDGRQIVYVLYEIYMQPFSLKYSCHPKIKEGEELLISNLKLPTINLCNEKK